MTDLSTIEWESVEINRFLQLLKKNILFNFFLKFFAYKTLEFHSLTTGSDRQRFVEQIQLFTIRVRLSDTIEKLPVPVRQKVLDADANERNEYGDSLLVQVLCY
jgi:hypothetical protein